VRALMMSNQADALADSLMDAKDDLLADLGQ
jgi:hypothetical protein